MSTRSITHIYSHLHEEIVCSFFRHCDGYPSGHGDDLANWLKGKRLVNGIGRDFVPGRDFNRAGTMAVKLMSHIQDLSGCEVIPTGQSGGDEEFIYVVSFKGDEFFIETHKVYGDIDSTIEKVSDYKGESLEKKWFSSEEDED